MEAFLLAAGLGTRLKPLTDSIPKALVKVNGVTLLEHTINNLSRYGAERIIINIHHFGDSIIDFLKSKNNFGLDIVISDEREKLLDTGGGLKKAIQYIKEDSFLIHNVDILSGIDLKAFMNFHSEQNSIATLAVQKRESSRYFLFDEGKNLCGWENVKTGEKRITRNPGGNLSRFAFSGIHAGTKGLSTLMPAEDAFSIVDFYLAIAETNLITYFDHTDTPFIDLGKIDSLAKAENLFFNK